MSIKALCTRAWTAGILLFSLVFVVGCEKSAEQAPVTTDSEAEIGDWGVATRYLSPTVKPGDDFFTYVNEGWLNKAEFPPSVPRIDSFVEVSLKAEGDIREIIADATADPANSNQAFIASLFHSYMDVERLNALGIEPIRPKLNKVFSAKNHNDIVLMMQQPGFTSVVDMGVDIDTRDPSRYIVVVGQGGLGLPSREYYLMEESPYPAHREAYAAYLKDLLTMAGLSDQVSHIPAVVEFETALANAHWSNADMRDTLRMTHYMTLAELTDYAPGLDWLAMLNSLDANLSADTVIVAYTDSALKASAALFKETPLDVIKAYMAVHLLDNTATLLGNQWQNRHFAFHGGRLQGLKEQRTREENAITLLNDSVGEMGGREYVSRHFPPNTATL